MSGFSEVTFVEPTDSRVDVERSNHVHAPPGSRAGDFRNHEAEAIDELAPTAPKPAAARILIADDDPTVRAVIRRILSSRLKADIRETDDGLGVLEALREGGVDLLILDIGMALLSGAETLEAIRSKDLFKNLPVIVISGLADETHVKRFKSLDVRGFFAKPILPVVLRERFVPLVAELLPARRVPSDQESPKLLTLRPSSRVFVVGSNIANTDLIRTSFGNACHLVSYPSTTTALRDIVSRPPDLVFLIGGDDLMSAALFATATRRESKKPPRLILCSSSDAAEDDNVDMFDAVLPRNVTADTLVQLLRSQLTERSISHIILHSVAADVLTSSMRVVVEATTGHAAEACRGVPRWNEAERHAVETTILMAADGLKWRFTLSMTQSFAIRHASEEVHGHMDEVSHEATIESMKGLAGRLAMDLRLSWARYGIHAEIGPLVPRPIRWWEQSVRAGDRSPAALWAAMEGAAFAELAVTVAPDD